MGVDASTTSFGWAFFDDDKLIDSGTLKPVGNRWQDRLVWLVPELIKLIKQYRPCVAYIENVPLKRQGGLETLVILGAVQGMIISLFASFGIQMKFLMPNQWRHDIGIYDGTREGTKRDKLKEKAVVKANELFGLNLRWVKPNSAKNEDDRGEAILIAFSQISKNFLTNDG